MSLRHALLALIEAGPMTGYEIAKQFDRSVDHIWHARHSQIYTELRKLEGDGLVAADVLPRGAGTVATKRAYRLTLDGAQTLMDWVAELQAAPDLRDSELVKATYLEYGSPTVARAFFRAHRRCFEQLRDRYEAHMDELRAETTPLLRRRLGHAPPAAHQAIVAFKLHAYDGLLARTRSEIEWAERGLQLVDRLATAVDDADAPLVDPRRSV